MKKFKIAFYVHHHGYGHLMRTLQIASKLEDYEIILLGSNLQQIENKKAHSKDGGYLRNIRFIHLPLDIASAAEEQNRSRLQPGMDCAIEECKVDTFHYAPLDISGIRDRVAIITEFFRTSYPLLLVVDVSVEIALLARLSSIPTVIMRQHGDRTDMPHLMAYQSATLLLAPYPEALYQGEKDWVYNKTIFAGGFSRFDSLDSDSQVNLPECKIAILIGGGGTSIDEPFINHLASACPDFFFHVIGNKKAVSGFANVKWEGHLENPYALLQACKIVLGNTGHNTVMEMASLNIRFIGIPEHRPFDEQLAKANSIADRKGIRIIQPGQLMETNWNSLISKLLLEQPDWQGVIAKDALQHIADTLETLGNKFFS